MRTPVVPSVQIFESKDPDFYSGFTLIKTETLCVLLALLLLVQCTEYNLLHYVLLSYLSTFPTAAANKYL